MKRAEFLKVLCGEDQAPCQRVETLLKAHKPDDSFMGGEAGGKATVRIETEDEALPEDVVGHTVGRYLAFSQEPRYFGVYDREKEQLLFLSQEMVNGAWQTRWSPDGAWLGIAEGNRQARVLNMTAVRSQLGELGLDW